jgi:hypothetical protein
MVKFKIPEYHKGVLDDYIKKHGGVVDMKETEFMRKYIFADGHIIRTIKKPKLMIPRGVA